MDDSETVALACMAFPARHRPTLHGANPLECLNNRAKRRADVVGIFPIEDRIIRLIRAVPFEQNDDWQSRHRDMQVDAFGLIDTAQTHPPLGISPRAARSMPAKRRHRIYTSFTDATATGSARAPGTPFTLITVPNVSAVN